MRCLISVGLVGDVIKGRDIIELRDLSRSSTLLWRRLLWLRVGQVIKVRDFVCHHLLTERERLLHWDRVYTTAR